MQSTENIPEILKQIDKKILLENTFEASEYLTTVVASLLSIASLEKEYESQAHEMAFKIWKRFPLLTSKEIFFWRYQTPREMKFHPVIDRHLYPHILGSIQLEYLSMYPYLNNTDVIAASLKMFNLFFSSKVNPIVPIIPDTFDGIMTVFSSPEAHLSLFGRSLYSNLVKAYLLSNKSVPHLLDHFNKFASNFTQSLLYTKPFYHSKTPLLEFDIAKEISQKFSYDSMIPHHEPQNDTEGVPPKVAPYIQRDVGNVVRGNIAYERPAGQEIPFPGDQRQPPHRIPKELEREIQIEEDKRRLRRPEIRHYIPPKHERGKLIAHDIEVQKEEFIPKSYEKNKKLVSDNEKEEFIPKSYEKNKKLVSDNEKNNQHIIQLEDSFFPGILLLASKANAREGRSSIARDQRITATKLMETYILLCDNGKRLPPKVAKINPDDTFEVINGTFDFAPHFVESLFIFWRETGDEKYKKVAWNLFSTICSQAYLKEKKSFVNVEIKDFSEQPKKLDVVSPDAFSSLKYFYLIFSDTAFLQSNKWVFNHHGHPLPVWNKPDPNIEGVVFENRVVA